MHIAVFGIGGVGAYITAKLGELFQKSDSRNTGSTHNSLSIIARGKHLDAIRKGGLTYVGPDGASCTVHPSRAVDSPAALAPVDVFILCVKGYDLDSAVERVAPLVARDTLLLPLLNGADIYERVRGGIPTGTVLPGAIYISSSIVEPGLVRHTGGKGLIITGREPKSEAPRPKDLLDIFEKAGIPYEWYEDPFPPIWSKFVFISPFGLITAASGKTIGGVLSDQDLKRDVAGMMEEVVAVARGRSVKLPEDVVEKTMEKAASFPPDTRTSLQRDVEMGRPKDERDLFGGAVVRLGKKVGVGTPITERYLDALNAGRERLI